MYEVLPDDDAKHLTSKLQQWVTGVQVEAPNCPSVRGRRRVEEGLRWAEGRWGGWRWDEVGGSVVREGWQFLKLHYVCQDRGESVKRVTIFQCSLVVLTVLVSGRKRWKQQLKKTGSQHYGVRSGLSWASVSFLLECYHWERYWLADLQLTTEAGRGGGGAGELHCVVTESHFTFRATINQNSINWNGYKSTQGKLTIVMKAQTWTSDISSQVLAFPTIYSGVGWSQGCLVVLHLMALPSPGTWRGV